MIPFSRDISVDNKVSGCPQCPQLRKQSYQLYPFFGVSERRCLVFFIVSSNNANPAILNQFSELLAPVMCKLNKVFRKGWNNAVRNFT